MGVIPTRMMPMGVRKRPPTTWDYVQDGLVAMWDGIENAGRGVHDANTATWKNLAGAAYDFTVESAATWQDNALLTNPNFSSPACSCSSQIPYESVVTMEVAFSFTDAASANRIEIAQLASLFEFQPGKMRLVRGLAYYNNFNGLYGWFVQQQYYAPDVGPISSGGYSVSVKYNGSSQPLSVVVNGVSKNTQFHEKGGHAGMSRSKMVIGSSETGNGFYGKVYSVRLYNRALSVSEVAANYAIDKARFKLP